MRPREINRVLPELLNLRHPPVLVNVSPEFRQRMNQESRNLMQFYRASLHAYEGDREAWAREIRELVQVDGGNPYYRWFVGQ